MGDLAPPAAISVLATGQLVDKAGKLFEQALKSGVELGSEVYVALLRLYSDNSAAEKCIEVYQNMTSRGIKANKSSLSLVMAACQNRQPRFHAKKGAWVARIIDREVMDLMRWARCTHSLRPRKTRKTPRFWA